MSQKQLENFLAKAKADKKIHRQLTDCGANKICVAEIGQKHGHKFSPANVGRWQRDHGGALFS